MFMLLSTYILFGWFGSRVVSVLDSGAEGPRIQIAAATLSGNSLRQTVYTHRASVHRAAKLVADLLRVPGVTAALRRVMAAYRRVYDSRHLQADCQEPGSAPEPFVRLSSMGYLYLLPTKRNALPDAQPTASKHRRHWIY